MCCIEKYIYQYKYNDGWMGAMKKVHVNIYIKAQYIVV